MTYIKRSVPTTIAFSFNERMTKEIKKMYFYLGIQSNTGGQCYMENYKSTFVKTRKGHIEKTRITALIPFFEILDSQDRQSKIINAPKQDIIGFKLTKKLHQETLKVNQVTNDAEIWLLTVLNEEGTIFAQTPIRIANIL